MVDLNGVPRFGGLLGQHAQFLRYGIIGGSYETNVVGRKDDDILDICKNWKNPEQACDCHDCEKLNHLSRTGRMIRDHPDYRAILDLILRYDLSGEGFKTILEVLFTEKQCPRKTCYRALTLLVCTHDVCSRIKNNDLKRDILSIVENAISKQNVDWTVIHNDGHKHTKWGLLKSIGLNSGVLFLRFYTYYLKM